MYRISNGHTLGIQTTLRAAFNKISKHLWLLWFKVVRFHIFQFVFGFFCPHFSDRDFLQEAQTKLSKKCECRTVWDYAFYIGQMNMPMVYISARLATCLDFNIFILSLSSIFQYLNIFFICIRPFVCIFVCLFLSFNTFPSICHSVSVRNTNVFELVNVINSVAILCKHIYFSVDFYA